MFNNFATTQCEWDATPVRVIPVRRERLRIDFLPLDRGSKQTLFLSHDGTRVRVIPVEVNKVIFPVWTLVWRKCYQVRLWLFCSFLSVRVFHSRAGVSFSPRRLSKFYHSSANVFSMDIMQILCSWILNIEYEALALSNHDHADKVLDWIENKLSLYTFFQPFKGNFRVVLRTDSDIQPYMEFDNNKSCNNFLDFIDKTLLERVCSGPISVLGGSLK